MHPITPQKGFSEEGAAARFGFAQDGLRIREKRMLPCVITDELETKSTSGRLGEKDISSSLNTPSKRKGIYADVRVGRPGITGYRKLPSDSAWRKLKSKIERTGIIPGCRPYGRIQVSI